MIGLVFSGIAILFDYGTFPSQADVKFHSIGKHGPGGETDEGRVLSSNVVRNID